MTDGETANIKIGLCHICGKPAKNTCIICGRPTCDSDFDFKEGICRIHRRGKRFSPTQRKM